MVKGPTLGFGLVCDLRIMRSSLMSGSAISGGACLTVCPSPSAPPYNTHTLSKKEKKRNLFEWASIYQTFILCEALRKMLMDALVTFPAT